MCDFSCFLSAAIALRKWVAGGPRHPILAAMAEWCSPAVRCWIVANVVLVATLAIDGCNAKGDPPGAPPVGGSGTAMGGDGGGSATGGASGGSTGSTISCNPTAGGCLCIVDDAQPGQLAECSPSSVAQSALEQGVCCVAQSLCTCLRYTCRSDPASSYCQCGSVLALAAVTLGAQVAECPAPTAEQKCCFSPDNDMCICSRLACAAEEIQVANCSGARAGACNDGETITACR